MKPDRVVFNALITACGQSGAVDRAFDVLSEMMSETQPIEPDHVTVGALMKACVNAGQVRFVQFKLQNHYPHFKCYVVAFRSPIFLKFSWTNEQHWITLG